ncbi:MCE family protein [Nocardioides piscis]|uniref:MCE family protein n=1 Tax=Nocardioides piscis TaxID=2714938 RepID=A0A6G7YJ11_9ACTN|nr:MCE family protein [Nocardioides piscis]QIK76717.1 MCE family protein [Nocardioides piscis]
MRRSSSRGFVRVGALALAAVLTSGCVVDDAYDLPLPGGKHSVAEEDGFEITAVFTDVLNVVPQTAVMVDDVPVGQVLDVKRVGWHAEVKLRIRKDVELPGDAVAEIRQASLLGEKYVALLEPSEASEEPVGAGTDGAGTQAVSANGDSLGEGDVIGLDQTGRNPEVEEVLGALSFLLSGGGVAQIKTISQELNKMMTGRTGAMRSVLSEVETLMTTLNGQRDDLIAAFDALNNLSKTLVAEKETIGDALDAMGPAIAVLDKQHDELVDLLVELDKLGAVGTRVINATKDDLIAQLRHLEPVLRELADADESLVPGLVATAAYPFPPEAVNAIKGDYANVAFLMQVNLTPVSQGGLVPTTLQELQTLCVSTPLAPVCSQAGPAVEQLCEAGSGLNVPLCRPRTLARVPAALSPEALARVAAPGGAR